ncbi:MAG TPA: pirin family protein [Polyangiales bacterium]|nr:pirin family protein [Polyangiales bacterium]
MSWAFGAKLLGGSSKEGQMQTSAQTKTRKPRALQGVYPPGPEHWVGDGFFVKTVFWPQIDPQMLSPFLLLDHAARRRFEPSPWRRGVGEHPHRGFETVTFAYEGEVEHRDSAGGGGRIGPGDVQWMTAASGVVHEEKHSQAFSERGGDFEMVQLWVNLPAGKKMSEPRYQPLLDREFPRLSLGPAEARLVAGTLEGKTGPAKTHTPITTFDLRFHEDGSSEVELPSGWTTLVFPLEGDVTVGTGRHPIPSRHFGVFDRNDDGPVQIHAKKGARVLVLAGEPLNEPVVAYGPFVMNTREEIVQAFRDYQSGRMGRLL